MFHLMANTFATGGAVTLTDCPAVADGQFSIRNGHYILSSPYNLLAAAALGPGISAIQSNTPHINYINPHQIYPAMLSATTPTNPQVDDYRSMPIPLPVNEEIAWQVSDANSEQVKLFTWIGTPAWKQAINVPGIRLRALFSQSVTTAAYLWSADTALTQVSQLRGGVYVVIGCQVVAAATLAFRLNFPRRPLDSGGRKTLPGDLATQTYGNIPIRQGRDWLGIWGAFSTFELPMIEVFANASASVTHTVYMDLVYVSDQTSALDQINNQYGMAA